MENAYGPEIQDLGIPMRVENWNGSAFETNTNDNCTSYDASNLGVTSFLSGGSTTANGSGILVSGEAPLGSQIREH